MTRDNHKNSHQTQPSLTIPTEDSIVNLPDLSTFQDEEKQHILNVLQRDEDLRNRHLSRFMTLRKEVADLEEQSQPASPSICARCRTPFSFIFNTGDACPKCSAKVCKQCRLMYNGNDNSWLCQLCCKQMQLMSYSGEWVYSLHSNLRKGSTTPSENPDGSLPASVSVQNINVISSSDSEPEDLASGAARYDRFATKPSPTQLTKAKPKDKINSLIVQTSVDEQKLNFVKERIKDRPLNASYTQPLLRRNRPVVSPVSSINTPNSSLNQTNNRQGRTVNKEKSPISKNIEVVKTRQQEVDLTSVTSSEWGVDDDNNKSEKDKLKEQQHLQPSTRNSKLNVAPTTTAKSRHKHLSASMQSLRNTVNRISHPHISSSRTSLNSEKNRQNIISTSSTIDVEDKISSKVKDEPSISNSRVTIQTPQSSVDESQQAPSNTNHVESSNTIVSPNTTQRQRVERHVSVADSVTTITSENSRQNSRDSKSGSIGNRESVGDSEDDIDHTFEKAKIVPIKRASSLKELRGSRLSLNSLMSEAKARYDLEITGTIELKLSYNMNTGSFDIFIKKCTNLACAKRNQTSNPYCKSYLLPDKSKSSKRKTTIRKGTIEPVFNETLRYHLSQQDFQLRTLWISVWSETSVRHKDFLGEIHIPLANCKLDQLEEYKLLPRVQPQEEDLSPTVEATTMDSSELHFELTFIENTRNKEKGTIQVNSIQGKGIYYGKNNVEFICKGLLMPDKIKRKLPITRKGPSPKWDIPLRWENISREDLKKTSMEISIWSQERFRKTIVGSIRLNSARGHLDSREVKSLVASTKEKAAWDLFQKNPTKTHYVELPLRPAITENK